MTTTAIPTTAGSTLAAHSFVNTHFNYNDSAYQDEGGTQPSVPVLTLVQALNVKGFREKLSSGVGQRAALNSSQFSGLKGFCFVCDINDNETQVRGFIHTLATSAYKNRYTALTGSNEPNDRHGGYNGGGVGAHWYDQAVAQQFWIWDQVQIEVNAGNWTATPGSGRPYVVGPGLMAAAGLGSESLLDGDIANLAAATYTTAGVNYHMADLCDSGDLHFYSGFNGPGLRVDGKDSNGAIPAGLTVSATDGKVSAEAFRLQQMRQVYDLKLTGGSASFTSGHYKYTGGSVTTGNGAAFNMDHSEGGTPTRQSGHDPDEWQALGAQTGPEMLVRDFLLGVKRSILYQAIDDPSSDPPLGMYRIADYPNGSYPIYDAVQFLLGLNGGEDFSTIGAWTDAISGALPDCGYVCGSAGAGHFYLYVTREADQTAYLTLPSGYTVEGVPLNGDGTYHLALADSMTMFHVKPVGGGGGRPVWTNPVIVPRQTGVAYSDTLAATGATSFAWNSAYTPPPGAILNTATGAVTGTRGATGAYPYAVDAINSNGVTTSPVVVAWITKPAIFNTISPPAAVVGQPFEYQLTWNADAFPVPTIKRTGAALPAGETCSPDGLISGTATTPGTTTGVTFIPVQLNLPTGTTSPAVTFVVNSGSGGTVTKPVFTKETPPDGQVGVRYGDDIDGDGIGDGYRFHAGGGAEAPTFKWGKAQPPAGTNLSASGVLRSTPTAVQTVTGATVIATNSAGSTESDPFDIEILDNGGGGNGDTLTYLLKPRSGFMAYIRVVASYLDEKDSARLVQIENVNDKSSVVARFKQSGKIDIDDFNGVSIGKGSNFFGTVGSSDDDWFRVGGVVNGGEDGDPIFGYMNFYADRESKTPTDTIPFSTTGDTPFQIEFGNRSGKIKVEIDSVKILDVPQEPAPVAPGGDGSGNLQQTFTLAGGLTPTSAIVNTRMTPTAVGQSVGLAYSTDASMATPTLATPATADPDWLVKHSVSALTQDTQYYGRLVNPTTGALLGEQFKFKTLPDGSGPWKRKIADWSCLNNPGGGTVQTLALDDLAAWGADEVWWLGDTGYWGQTIPGAGSYTKDLQKYDKSVTQLPALRAVAHCAAAQVMTRSDHELHANGDQWGGELPGQPLEDQDGAHNCPHTIREMTASVKQMPVRSWADGRNPKRFRSFYYDIGAQVRVIVTDLRSPDRNNANDPDGPNKQLWGAEQQAWIESVMVHDRVLIFVSETSWWWQGSGTIRATDKPAAYPYWQQRLLDKCNATGDFSGQQPYATAWVGGDRHRVSYFAPDDPQRTAQDFPGPQYISSGIGGKDALALQQNENVTYSSFVPTNTIDKFEMAAWQGITIEYDGVSTVTITPYCRVATAIRQVSDGHTTVNSTHITSATALFTSADVGQLIAGDGIVNQVSQGGKLVDSPTYITAVDPDGLGATISQAAKANKSAGTWTIQNNYSQWVMQDFPGGIPRSDSWSLSGGGGGGSIFLPNWIG